MKKFLQIVLIILFGNLIVKAQESIDGELSFRIINNNGSLVEIEYELISLLCWDADIVYPDIHNITTLFNEGSLSTTLSVPVWLEFLACWESTPPNYDHTFGLGYYKFTAKVNGIVKDYFYIDYRTSNLPENYNSGGSGDIGITFDVIVGKFYYYSSQNEFPTFTTIWDEKPWIGASTSELPDFWENALVLVDDGNNHPLLVWGPYSSQLGVDHYNIYKKIGNGQFELYVEIDALQYIDENEHIIYGPPQANGTVAHYKIAAVYPTGGNNLETSEFTNTVSARVEGDPFYKPGYLNHRKNNQVFSLFQNYPNPFNPTTIIKYHLSETKFVNLKVYDISGKEIATLVNEIKEPGSHTVEFNASDLSSGVYLYRMKIGTFVETRKFIYQK